MSGSHRIRCRCCAVLHVRLEVSAQSLAISEQQNRELHAALEGFASAAMDADRLQHELDAAATEHAAADRACAAERAERVRVVPSLCVGRGGVTHERKELVWFGVQRRMRAFG